MADDETKHNEDAELPTPDGSPFFSPESSDQEESPSPAEPPQPATEPVAESPESVDESELAEEEQQNLSPEPESPKADLGSTEPHTPLAEELADQQVSQRTQLLQFVDAEAIPGFDPQVAQPTEALPALASEPATPGLPAVLTSLSTVTAGSRVVIVVSRGVPEIPPTALVGAPHVVGMSQGEALSQLQQAGLSAQVFNEYCRDTARRSDRPAAAIRSQRSDGIRGRAARVERTRSCRHGVSSASGRRRAV